MTPREALLSAARVCRDRADVHGQRHAVAFEMEALRCELAILALAEQEDQRGAAENTRRDESTSAGSTPAQSAPHPDPAGQEGCGLQGSKGFVPTVEQGQPALPGPETVSVPREPTQDWMREFCRRPELDSLDGSEDLQDAVRIILSALAAGSAK